MAWNPGAEATETKKEVEEVLVSEVWEGHEKCHVPTISNYR